MIFTNTGELLLRVRRPGHDILESLAGFSRARRQIDDWHFDIAAFPAERIDVWERLGASAQTWVRSLAPYWALTQGLSLSV
jgi:hypothetical protein